MEEDDKIVKFIKRIFSIIASILGGFVWVGVYLVILTCMILTIYKFIAITIPFNL